MIILSFDVGVKNLALCLINYDNACVTIDDWSVIDLCNDDKNTTYVQCMQHRKNVLCYKPAKFVYKNQNYCGICAKTCSCYTNNGSFDVQKIIKMKKERLLEIAEQHELPVTKKDNKENIKQRVVQHITDHEFRNVAKVCVTDFSLIDIGRNLHSKMNDCLEKWNTTIDIILIENQISPIANRMKTLQGMITQYFIMKTDAEIMYVSSENKLRDHIVDKTNYAQRKKDSVEITRKLIESDTYNIDSTWIDIFANSKKKDDLSDTLLQGLWYINNKL